MQAVGGKGRGVVHLSQRERATAHTRNPAWQRKSSRAGQSRPGKSSAQSHLRGQTHTRSSCTFLAKPINLSLTQQPAGNTPQQPSRQRRTTEDPAASSRPDSAAQWRPSSPHNGRPSSSLAHQRPSPPCGAPRRTRGRTPRLGPSSALRMPTWVAGHWPPAADGAAAACPATLTPRAAHPGPDPCGSAVQGGSLGHATAAACGR